MRITVLTILALFTLSLLVSCNSEQKENEKLDFQTDLVVLESDLTVIPDSLFIPLDAWLSDYKLLGFAEGDHGFNESLDFRNSYIKYLIKTNQIRILAFESGLLESKMVNDFINGEDLNLDSVLTNGMSYTFGQFEQSKELLTWLRKENKTRSREKRVQFYGFDMAGNAPNPYLENSSFALVTCMDYLKSVDTETYQKYEKGVAAYLPYLSTKDEPESKEVSFLELSEEKRKSLLKFNDELISTLKKNKEAYIRRKGKSQYEWGLQAAKCAKQNSIFLEGYNSTPRDQSARERFMLDNLDWIMSQEKNEKIFLFAHLAHLAKDITIVQTSGVKTDQKNMFGEHLREKFGDEYKLVAHTYCFSDYYSEVDSVDVSSLPYQLNLRYEPAAFLLNFNSKDKLFSQPRMVGTPLLSGNVWIVPNKAIDVIFHTDTQYYFYQE